MAGPQAEAQNQPKSFDNRQEMLRQRLHATGDDFNQQRLNALTKDLYRQKTTAYRQALIREGAKWGVYDARGPIDPFIEAQLWHDSETSSTQILSTYMKRKQRAMLRGEDMDAWTKKWWTNKAPQVLQWEYGKSDYQAVRDFYQNNLGTIKQTSGWNAVAQLWPREAAVPDICERLIDEGDVDVAEAINYPAPYHLNCFPAGTIVTGPSFHTVFSRPYQGPIVTIRTARGNELTGTPNHPILTAKGWVPLGALREGDSLFSSANPHEMMRGTRPDEQHIPTPIEQIGATSAMSLRQMPSSTADFHNDGLAQSYVNVVHIDGSFQRDRHAASSAKQIKQNALRVAGVRAGSFSAPRPSGALFKRGFRAATSYMSLFGTSSTNLRRKLGIALQIALSIQFTLFRLVHAVTLGGAQRAKARALLLEDSRQSIRADAKLVRQRVAGLAPVVTPDHVISVRQDDFSGHVYNASSIEGWYAANGIIVSNCPHYWVILNKDTGEELSSDLSDLQDEQNQQDGSAQVQNFTSAMGQPEELPSETTKLQRVKSPQEIELERVAALQEKIETAKEIFESKEGQGFDISSIKEYQDFLKELANALQSGVEQVLQPQTPLTLPPQDQQQQSSNQLPSELWDELDPVGRLKEYLYKYETHPDRSTFADLEKEIDDDLSRNRGEELLALFPEKEIKKPFEEKLNPADATRSLWMGGMTRTTEAISEEQAEQKVQEEQTDPTGELSWLDWNTVQDEGGDIQTMSDLLPLDLSVL